MKLDVILPIYNEEQALPTFVADLTAHLDKLELDWCIHMIVDHGTDRTPEVVADLCKDEPRLKALLLSSRFGHQEALCAGLGSARPGASALMMDADGQHPPELIGKLIDALSDDIDIVVTRRLSNVSQPFMGRLMSNSFYRVLSSLSGVALEPGMADFRLLAPHVVRVLRQAFQEQSPFLRGLIHWMGFHQAVVEYHAVDRVGGHTKYTLRRRFRFARQAILAFSQIPLRIAAPLGFFISGLAVLYGIYLALFWFVSPTLPPGWTTNIVAILFLGGLQLAFIGILGEYLANIHRESKRRPRFIVRSALNYEEGDYPLFG